MMISRLACRGSSVTYLIGCENPRSTSFIFPKQEKVDLKHLQLNLGNLPERVFALSHVLSRLVLTVRFLGFSKPSFAYS